MSDHKDTLYSNELDNVKPFAFNQQVADVFSDMISRSVPSYQPILKLLPTLVKSFYMPGCNYYDLGCSLGAGLHAIAYGLSQVVNKKQTSLNLIGLDTSDAMLCKAQTQLPSIDGIHFSLENANILDYNYNNAAMVLLNFTLQFLPVEHRTSLLKTLYQSLAPGGALLLSEKVCFDDSVTNQLLIDIHHQYKADQGYSKLEIAQKRDAIENVLIPETLDHHLQRLKKAGFTLVTPCLQNLQFVSILAVKK